MKAKDILMFIIQIFIIIIVFWGCYCIWFYVGGNNIKEKEISIKFITSKDSSAISQNQQQLSELKQILKQIEDQQLKRQDNHNREYYLTISSLNAFYGSLFTAFAVIAAILGLSVWITRTNLEEKSKELEEKSKELEKKFKELEEIGKKVEILDEKRKLAKWVREGFENNEKNDISSSMLNLSENDKKKMDRTKEYMINEITDDSWLEIVLITQLLEEKKDDVLDKALKVLKFIENRDLLDEDSNIEAVLYHMLGRVYHEQNSLDNEKNKKKDPKELLHHSKEYYEKAISCGKRRDETHGNLAVVLIELAKLHGNDVKEKYLGEATKHLERVIKLNKATYNTYFDLAKVEYLKDEKNEESVLEFIDNAITITSTEQKRSFLKYINEDEELKDGIKKIIRKKLQLLK